VAVAIALAGCGNDDTVGGGFASSAECLDGTAFVTDGDITAAELAERCEATLADARVALDEFRASSASPGSTAAASTIPESALPAATASTSAEVSTSSLVAATTAADVSTTALPGAPVATAVVADPGVIPGLAPVDIYLNLEDVGYDCADPEDVGSRIAWVCVDPIEPLARVEIFGPSPARVSFVDATASAGATQSLEFIATIPYDGSDPDGARTWVADAARKASAAPLEDSFGGVPFRVTSLGDAVVLQIGSPS